MALPASHAPSRGCALATSSLIKDVRIRRLGDIALVLDRSYAKVSVEKAEELSGSAFRSRGVRPCTRATRWRRGTKIKPP